MMLGNSLSALLGRLISLMQGVVGDEWEANVVLRHKPTGQALSAGVSDPSLLLDALQKTIVHPEAFEGKMNSETGEVVPADRSRVQ